MAQAVNEEGELARDLHAVLARAQEGLEAIDWAAEIEHGY
jgi:hypothetical protein